jgi:hypothetical protein
MKPFMASRDGLVVLSAGPLCAKNLFPAESVFRDLPRQATPWQPIRMQCLCKNPKKILRGFAPDPK